MMNESRVLGITDVLSQGSQLEYTVPEKSFERVGAFVDAQRSGSNQNAPVAPRLSSTVMLLRERAHPQDGSSFAVFVQQRASSMAFVPDAVVFPGGSFDAMDDTCEIPWEGPLPSRWAQRMGCSEDTARRAFVTAAREVFEESGVLLARRKDGSELLNLAGSEELQSARSLLAGHKLAFGQLLSDMGLVLWTDLFCPCAHWVTPPSEPRRYSTFFFRAKMPQGQCADGKTSEAVRTGWANPEWLLEQQRAGALIIMPPTISNLCDLTQAQNVTEACAQRQTVHVYPEPTRKEDGTLVFRSVVR